ncbi:M23 family metallopeptidase [Rubrolithibacter danxiaensis]|uniref:M23 family metallopeptidase n=1 Tax=Rubrolithibacter danxiaensis TaxID=3390805 RepID=UPI003BF7B3E5
MREHFSAIKLYHSIYNKHILFLFLFTIFFSVRSYPQNYKITERTRFYTEELPGDSVVLKVSNEFVIPLTLNISFTLLNLESTTPLPLTTVIPGKALGKVVAAFKRTDRNTAYKCSYNWRIVYGDFSQTPDLNFAYKYPFVKGVNYKISQGPNGNYSHKNIIAYDFAMPERTPVCAARDGIVALVRTDSDKGGPDPKYIDDANFITVYHTDGTLANYYHLSKNGAAVKEGQWIKQGQIIGYSGNTGFSNGPHLHFEITRPDISSDTKQWISFNWDSGISNTLSMNDTESSTK